MACKVSTLVELVTLAMAISTLWIWWPYVESSRIFASDYDSFTLFFYRLCYGPRLIALLFVKMHGHRCSVGWIR